MTLLATALTYAPLLALGPIAVGGTTIHTTLATNRRNRLIDGWTGFSQAGQLERIDALTQADEQDLVFDTPTRVAALTLLSALEHLGRQASARRGDWEVVLPLDMHARIKLLVGRCRALIAVVRTTNVPLDVRCFNGHRRRAFANLIRAFS